MKMNEIKGLETKELAEKLETEVANYENLTNNKWSRWKQEI